ncbi:rhomboid family intramembrane serine protease [Spirosoma aerolatum]|uniref:rhomboid family intramembrane serine protease n=1 Tax=Spirosoma aerolatum TaxID=1211326 RepID=UPI0009AF068E|nr:rhomboid family intramembrane serine protease [Spirosoma aerolatum]
MSDESPELPKPEELKPKATTPSPSQNNLPEPVHAHEQTFGSEPPADEKTNPLDLLKPAPGYTVTPILIWLNVGIFLLMAVTGVNILRPAGDALIRWGANYTPLTLDDQPWRLLSSCFLHIGIIHLLFNMYALTQIGFVIEGILGSRKFIIVYLMAGLLGSAVSLWWHDVVLGAGASGAIFGLYGVFFALLTTDWLEAETRRSLLRSVLVFMGYNLLFGLQSGIDNAAHIGGLVAGVLFGYAYYFAALHPSRRGSPIWWPLLVPTAIILVVTGVVYKTTANPFGAYERLMNRFGALEKEAMSVFQLPRNTPASGVAKAINERGITAWKQAITVLNEADKLELPDEYHQRNALLRQYSTLRINSFTLLGRSLTDTTHRYDKQIEDYDRRLQTVLNELKKKP